ncbi:hypothetical protein [Haloarcula amylovorans]|uniref:hypothetical protein n=1 Tax=Haloarcula amylovorans TaxID=2562280 RepID=UPI00107604F6|nr:hypothetical protein [Halomicroarcula amylolytica]
MAKPLIEKIQSPEYTGEDRCLACTVVNLVIALAISLVASRRSKRVSAAVFTAATVLIYLRGYIIPGTPTLTKQYLPAAVLEWFGKDPKPPSQTGLGAVNSYETGNRSGTSKAATNSQANETADGIPEKNSEDATDIDTIDEINPETLLLENNILVPCEQQDDLCLDEDFRQRWQAMIAEVNDNELSASDAVNIFGLEDVAEYNIKTFDDGQVLEADGRRVGQWPSETALVADIAAARIATNDISNWERLSPNAKGQSLNALRLFLETCPTGNGDVELDTETVESCCQSYDVVAARCAETGDRLFEHPVDDIPSA